jgi:uncharacterized protein
VATQLEGYGTVLLSGVVGSTTYGLAGAGSDVDRLGMFAAPTRALLGLSAPAQSRVTTKPDATFHEAGKAARLILAGNPTATELLWLPEDLYESRTPLGEEAIALRTSFLSAKRTRDAYLGYATQQFKKLLTRGDGASSGEARNRTAKHARHLMRLVDQGFELYTTGNVVIRLADPDGISPSASRSRPTRKQRCRSWPRQKPASPARAPRCPRPRTPPRSRRGCCGCAGRSGSRREPRLRRAGRTPAGPRAGRRRVPASAGVRHRVGCPPVRISLG